LKKLGVEEGQTGGGAAYSLIQTVFDFSHYLEDESPTNYEGLEEFIT